MNITMAEEYTYLPQQHEVAHPSLHHPAPVDHANLGLGLGLGLGPPALPPFCAEGEEIGGEHDAVGGGGEETMAIEGGLDQNTQLLAEENTGGGAMIAQHAEGAPGQPPLAAIKPEPDEGMTTKAEPDEGIAGIISKAEPELEMTAEQIGEAALAAAAELPLEARPRKIRKKNEEFTIAKKLMILSELDGPGASTVRAVAEAHGTTKASVYRWKKDRRRLTNLARREGKGETIKRARGKWGAAKYRKMNNEEFTTAEKLSILKELDLPNMSVAKMSDKHGANKKSIYRWRKDRERLVRIVETEGRGECKRVGIDPLERVKAAVKAFHDQNALLPQEERLSFTGAIIAAKARQSKDHFLAEHAVRPFLSNLEVKALGDFTASESWGRKVAQRFGWSSGARRKSAAAAEAAATAAITPQTKKTMGRPRLAPVKAEPGAKAGAAAQKQLHIEISAMHTDMAELRERTEGAEERELRLANDNEELRREIAWLKMRQI